MARGGKSKWDSKDGTNHLGERTFQTYNAWRASCKAINPNVQFEGDKDMCQAKPGIGEWDGNEGIIYTKDVKDESLTTYKGYVVSQISSSSPLYLYKEGSGLLLKEVYSIEEAKKEIDKLVGDSTTDKENIYYSTIVAAARERNDYRITKEDAKKRVEQAFKNISVNFNEEEFNKAFHEFRTANASRIVYRPS